MIGRLRDDTGSRFALEAAIYLLAYGGCNSKGMPMDAAQLEEFRNRYTAAWCSQDAASVAVFFAEDRSLTINDGEPSVGRAAITEVVQGFLTAFPDMVVTMGGVSLRRNPAVYGWTLTGTNTGPVILPLKTSLGQLRFSVWDGETLCYGWCDECGILGVEAHTS